MSTVWGALGYDETAFQIGGYLQSARSICLVDGPPGSGKSMLCKGVGGLWEAEGGSVILAEGDRLRSDVPLHTLGYAMASLSSGWRGVGTSLADAAQAGEALVGTGGIISGAVKALSQLRPRRRRARIMYLAEAEQQILFDLERHGGGRPILLIADNLHWWDANSLEFLGRLRTAPMRAAFPFLAEMRVLAVQTSGRFQPVANPTERDALLAAEQIRTVDLDVAPRKPFPDVLSALGGVEVDAATADAVYTLTGGHLALAHRCALRIADGDGPFFLNARDTNEFVHRLLTERLQSLGQVGEEALRLLRIAAVLGLRFRRDEIVCAWEGGLSEASRILRFLRDQDLVELSGDSGWFVHDLFRQHFLQADRDELIGIHERVADCLRQLSPTSYQLRCETASQAGWVKEAGAIAVSAGLARLREGRNVDDLAPASQGAIDDAALRPVAQGLWEAYTLLEDDQVQASMAVLDRLPHSIPQALAAEADLVRAECLMATRSELDQAKARSLLEAWSGLEEEEPDLGRRIMQVLLYAFTMGDDKAGGRALEATLRDVLRSRVEFDPSAEDALYILDRCSPSLYEPDVAVRRVAEAVSHFAPDSEEGVVRRPGQYYRALVNGAAQLVVNARYDEAVLMSARLEQLVDSHAPGTFPRLEDPRTTGVLAEYRHGMLSSGEAADRQRAIVERVESADPFYACNALAVYVALSGQAGEAIAQYDRLLAELAKLRDPEPSMLYLLRSNRCVSQFVAGHRDGVVEEWGELEGVLRRIPYVIGRYLVRRHELLTDVMKTGAPTSAAEFDVVLTRGRQEYGPMWDQLGRGFRMPEVMWWH